MDVKQQIKLLAHSIMFDLDNEECDKIVCEFNNIAQGLDLIKTIDVDNLEPTNFINDKINIDEFDNDIVETYNDKEVFSNSKNYHNHFVEIKNEK